MSNLFKQLAEALVDRQELRMNIKKIGDDLVVTVTPNFKEAKQNIEMSGTPEELDLNFITELKKPLEIKTTFTSNADEVATKLEEDLGEEKEIKEKATSKKSDKKADAKKKAGSKTTKATPEEMAEEPAPKAEEKKVIEKTPEEVESAAKKKALEQYVKDGEQYMKERKYPDAEAAFKKALDIEPENKLIKEKYESAAKWVRAITKLHEPTQPPVLSQVNSQVEPTK
jgi:PRTRC genetic system protein E